MTIEETRVFYKTHEHKTGNQLREELLKLSPEDMYDCIDEHYQDLIHGWRQALFAAENKVKFLSEKIEKIEKIMKEVVHNLIMLPAHKSNIILHKDNTLSHWRNVYNESQYEYRHVYVYTNEQPQAGDFYIIFDVSGNGSVYQCVRREKDRVYYGIYQDEILGSKSCTSDDVRHCHKLIGTTDAELYYSPQFDKQGSKFCTSRLTDEFIKEFFERYNQRKDISKVHVQYFMDHVLIDFDHTIKVRYK